MTARTGVAMLPRELTQKNERLILAPGACKSENSKGRSVYEPPCDMRTEFQRDRDRITHSNAFRRLKHKTQVFLIPRSDHYRTRLTHTLEVSQIARTIARCLRLNEDLTEAIALGHDLGHTPFGHDGEHVLNNLYSKGFRHYEQSVRVIEKIERDGMGLNLTKEVLNGILHHTSDTPPAMTLEGVVVQLSDKIAYINHDIEDAIRGNVIKQSDLPAYPVEVLGKTKSERITSLIRSLVKNSTESEIRYDEETKNAHDELRDFMFERVYLSSDVNEEKDKACHVVEFLYKYYNTHPEKLTGIYAKIAREQEVPLAVCDFISGMTDGYAVDLFKELCIPKRW